LTDQIPLIQKIRHILIIKHAFLHKQYFTVSDCVFDSHNQKPNQKPKINFTLLKHSVQE